MSEPRRLTDVGLRRYQQFLDSLDTEKPETYNRTLLSSDEYSTSIGGGEVPDTCNAANRMEMGQLLYELLANSGLKDVALDRGFWSWLSWYWFDSLCPEKNGRLTPMGSERWIFELGYTRRYRHLLAGPWSIYDAHRENPERAMCLLCTPVTSPGDLVSEIASRQEYVNNPALVEVLTLLYYDPDKKVLRSGHVSRSKPGAVKRMIKVVGQLSPLWDLYSVTTEELMELLPAEFDRFKKTATRRAA